MSKHDSNEQREVTLNDIFLAIEKNQEHLEEIARWSKIEGAKKLKEVLERVVDTPEKKKVYQLSDGRGAREINAVCNVSIGAISNYWNVWDRLGLMKKTKGAHGHDRFIKAFELEDYGIEIPKIIQKTQTGEQKYLVQSEDQQIRPIIQNESDGDQNGK